MKRFYLMLVGTILGLSMGSSPSAHAWGRQFEDAAKPRLYTYCENGTLILSRSVTFTSRAQHDFPIMLSSIDWSFRLDGNRVIVEEARSHRSVVLGTIGGTPDNTVCQGAQDPHNPGHSQNWDLTLNADARLLYSIEQAHHCRYIQGGGWFGGAPGWYKALKISLQIKAPRAELTSNRYDWGNQTNTRDECEKYEP